MLRGSGHCNVQPAPAAGLLELSLFIINIFLNVSNISNTVHLVITRQRPLHAELSRQGYETRAQAEAINIRES